MIPAMGIDSYWRTRTIAEGQSQGYSHLRAVCSGVRAGPDIPWLLLSAKSNEGQGAFKNVTFIQRLGTHGGKPPTADADAAHAGKEVRVEYQATYYFYVPGP